MRTPRLSCRRRGKGEQPGVGRRAASTRAPVRGSPGMSACQPANPPPRPPLPTPAGSAAQAWRVYQRGIERWLADLLQPLFDSLVAEKMVPSFVQVGAPRPPPLPLPAGNQVVLAVRLGGTLLTWSMLGGTTEAGAGSGGTGTARGGRPCVGGLRRPPPPSCPPHPLQRLRIMEFTLDHEAPYFTNMRRRTSRKVPAQPRVCRCCRCRCCCRGCCAPVVGRSQSRAPLCCSRCHRLPPPPPPPLLLPIAACCCRAAAAAEHCSSAPPNDRTLI